MRSLIKLPFLPVTFFNSGNIKMSVEKFLMIVGNTRYLTLNVVGVERKDVCLVTP